MAVREKTKKLYFKIASLYFEGWSFPQLMLELGVNRVTCGKALKYVWTHRQEYHKWHGALLGLSEEEIEQIMRGDIDGP